MGIALSVQQLKALTDEEIERYHDQEAEHTMVGTQYFLDELGRREQDKLNKEMLELTRDMHRMTTTMTRATYVALALAVLSLIVGIVAILA
jgi:hypothetical protein